MAARRSKEEIIQALEAKLQKLKAQPEKDVKLTKHSAGMAEVIAAVEHAAAQNAVAASEIIKAVAKLKRTGLKIEDSPNKTKG